jgi:hypothetical protein
VARQGERQRKEARPVSGYARVPANRATLTTVGGGVDVSIPSRRNYFVAVFLVLWLCGWTIGETSAWHTLTTTQPANASHHEPMAFLAVWLCLWTIGGCAALVAALWNIAGREQLRFSGSEVTLRREVFGVGFGTRYDPTRVSNLRCVEVMPGPFGTMSRSPFGWGGGPLAFDYGAKSIRFGAGVDSAEGQPLVEKIIAAVPRLRRSQS